jgi:microcystin-dependent protein
MVVDYAGSAAPVGWLMCDGQSFATVSYPALFSVIGYTYGGSGAVFNVPDARGRAAIGAGAGPGLTNRGLGAKGGEEAHVLSVSELAVHNHGINDPGHSHSVYDPSHVHSLWQNPHSHGVADPGHAHSVWDPTHAHSIADPGHTHPYIYGNWTSSGVGNAGTEFYNNFEGNTGASATRIGIYASATGIGIYAAGTGIGIGAANASIGLYGAATGISIYASATGISTQSAGANGGHNTMMPFISFSKIIKT